MQMHTVKAGKTEFTILFTEFSDADGDLHRTFT